MRLGLTLALYLYQPEEEEATIYQCELDDRKKT